MEILKLLVNAFPTHRQKLFETIATLLERFLDLLGNLSDDEISSLIRLGLKYPPATRALVGAICEQTMHYSLVAPLLKSLNPITKYKLVNADNVLTYLK